MAFAVLNQVEAPIATYDAINATLNITENAPAGILVHTAGGDDSSYFVYNVWDSEGDWERFRDERLRPAIQEVAPQIGPPKTSTWELHAFTTF